MPKRRRISKQSARISRYVVSESYSVTNYEKSFVPTDNNNADTENGLGIGGARIRKSYTAFSIILATAQSSARFGTATTDRFVYIRPATCSPVNFAVNIGVNSQIAENSHRR